VSRVVLCSRLWLFRGHGTCAVWTLCFCPVCGARRIGVSRRRRSGPRVAE
jgi:hypothetical protein